MPDFPTETQPERRNWVWSVIQIVLRLAFALWLRYRARGHDKITHRGGMLLIINHQSFLDPLLVGLPLRRPVSFLARDNLFRVPFVGWVLRNTYVLPINRESAATGALREMIARLKAGFWVGIFPEGTRSTTVRWAKSNLASSPCSAAPTFPSVPSVSLGPIAPSAAITRSRTCRPSESSSATQYPPSKSPRH